MCLLSTFDIVSKLNWKRKGELGQRKGFHCIPVSMYLVPSSYLCSHCLLVLFDIFGEAMGLKDQIVILFWCLMPKGDNLRTKQLDQPTTCEFQNFSVRFLVFGQNPLIAKIVLLWGRNLIMGKGGVFGIWSNLLLKDLLICQNKCFWYRDRKKNLFCKNKPSGGKSDPNIPNPMWDKLVFKFALFSFSLKM